MTPKKSAITITKTIAGVKCYLYKIFDLVIGEKEYTYVLTDSTTNPWKNFINPQHMMNAIWVIQ